MSDIFKLACKELETLSESDQEYFTRYMMQLVHELEAKKTKDGQYPTSPKRRLTAEQRDFIEKLRVKHGVKTK